MVLFVSDTHFRPGTDRASESSLIQCLRAHQADLQHLILGGDLFDAYIEYPTLVPKGCVRLMGCLADLADEGVEISYILGNHDCWHRDYFESELGVRICPGALSLHWNGLHVHAEHGDATPGTSGLRRAAKYVLRHPVPGALYRTLIPADLGMRFAQFVKGRLDARGASSGTAQTLRLYAHGILERTPSNLVILGHSHKAEIHVWPTGTYINAGSWRDGGHYVLLTDAHMQLRRWDGQLSEILRHAPIQPGKGNYNE